MMYLKTMVAKGVLLVYPLEPLRINIIFHKVHSTALLAAGII